MSEIYVDLNLTTGTEAGTSWANAYQSWADMITGEAGTLTEDTDINFRSDGTVDEQCSLVAAAGWDVSTYTLRIMGDTVNDSIMYRSVTWADVTSTNLDGVEYWNIITLDGRDGFNIQGALNKYYNCVSIGAASDGFYKTGDAGSGGIATFYNCDSVDNGAQGFHVGDYRHATMYNCYSGGNGTTDYYLAGVNGTMTLNESGSSDATGSTGLTSIAYSTDNFTNVTSGSEDLHLVSGSDLIDEGTTANTSSTDADGVSRSGTTCDIGAFEYVSSGSTYTLDAATGSMALTGTLAGLLFNRLLSAAAGSHSLTGTAADLLFNRILSASNGSAIITGTDASLLFNRLLAATGAPYTISGTDAELFFDRLLSAESGPHVLTGQDASLRYSRGYLLTAEAGSYTLTGSDASLLRSFKLLADSGAHALTGQDVAFMRKYIIDAGLGQITLSGKNATLSYSGIPIAVFPISATITETAAVLAAISANMISSDLTESIITGVLDDNS